MGCTSDGASPSEQHEPPAAERLAARLCRARAETALGRVEDPALTELSGFATTPASPGVLWAQQDSGTPAELFAIDPTSGAALGRFAVDAENVDWEDLAADTDGSLLIADTGDNDRRRDSVEIIAVRVPSDPRLVENVTLPATRIAYRYPDGAQDVEALFVDPETGDRYVLTKPFSVRDLSFDATTIVYRLDPPADDSGTGSATEVARLDLGFAVLATGADMARDGRTLIVRTYGSTLVWDRAPGTSIAGMFEQEPCTAPSPVFGQNEAIAFTEDGEGFVTASEGARPTLWLVQAAP